MKYYSESNLPLPEFRNISEGFMVTVFIEEPKNVTDKVTDNQNEGYDDTKDDTKEVTKEVRLKNILLLIRKQRGITIPEIARKCNVSIETIKRDLIILKKRMLIERIGGRKIGEWKILEKPSDFEKN